MIHCFIQPFMNCRRQNEYNNNRQIFRSGLMYIMIFVAIVGLVSWFNQGSNGQTTEVSYTQFVQELKKR